MTKEAFEALLAVAGVSEDGGSQHFGAGRTATLHLSHGGAQLSVARVESVQLRGELVEAHDQKGQVHIFSLDDLFAATCSAPKEDAAGRSAGFRP